MARLQARVGRVLSLPRASIFSPTGQRWGGVLRGHSGALIGAEFAGGHLIVTAGRDGTVRSYRCVFCAGVDDLIVSAEQRLGRG